MEPPFPLSILVVACDEERNLRRCLASVAGLAGEVVVVDSGSKDATVEVAESAGARVYFNEWTGFRDQKNFALSKCSEPWVLVLDADERVSPVLRDSIEGFFRDGCGRCEGASFARKVWFMGRWIRHGDWYPDVKVRLGLREKSRFSGDAGHDRMEVAGSVTRLAGDLEHFSFPSMNRYVEKINGFSDAFLERELARGRHWSLARNLSRPAWRFFRGYVIRRGFLDGFPGIWIAVAVAFQAFVRHSRLYKEERNEEARSVSGRTGETKEP